MSQIHPIGRDNLNQLIQLQLGTEAFDVIHKVASNLEDLKKISEALEEGLETLPVVQSMNEKLQELETQVQSIHTRLDEVVLRLNTIQQSP